MGRKEKPMPAGRTHTPTIGELLRRLRNEQGLSLVGMADLTGFSRGHLSNVEIGRIQPSQVLLRQYEEYLGLQPSEISAFFLLLYTETIPIDSVFTDVSQIDLKNALEIAMLVDCFPPALEHIAAFIRSEGCDLSGYLKLYQPQVADLLRRHCRRYGIHKPSLVTLRIRVLLEN